MKFSTIMAQARNVFTFSVLLPFVYGCNGGSGSGGGSSFVGSLFGNSGSGVSGIINQGGGDTATALAAVHQPEPATMLLLGSGALAMGLMRRQKNQGR